MVTSRPGTGSFASSQILGDDGDVDELPNVSYTFDLEGLEAAPDIEEIEDALHAIAGVRARIVFPKHTAWISAPSIVKPEQIVAVFTTFGVEAMMTETSEDRYLHDSRSRGRRRRSQRRRSKLMTRPSWRLRRQQEEEDRAAERARAAGYFDVEASEAGRIHSDEEPEDVLFTSRDLVTRARLYVALILGIPIIAINYNPDWQFPWWQWVTVAMSAPVVLWSAWPFHRALVGGVRRGLVALDGASAVAILAAYAWSASMVVFTDAGAVGWTSPPKWFAIQHGTIAEGELFLDVACGMTILLLVGRLLTMRSRISLLDLIDARRPNPHSLVKVARRGRKSPNDPFETLPLQEVNVGDDVLVEPGDIVPVDGSVIGGSAIIAPGAVGGTQKAGDEVNPGSQVFAGTRTIEGRIKVRVARTGHGTRMAATRRWVAAATRHQNRATMLSTRTAALLIPTALTLAVVDFVLWWMIGGNMNAAFATALAVLASVAPVALALSTALAVRHGIEALARHGIMMRDGRVIRRLDSVDTVVFNRLGTLTEDQMSVQAVTEEEGENPELLLRVAGALVVDSDHPVSRAIVHAARESRDRDTEDESVVPHFIQASRVEITEDGAFTGMVELPVPDESGAVTTRPVEAMLWRPRTMSELPAGRLSRAVAAGGTPVLVRWRGRDRGVITLTDTLRPDGPAAIDDLEELGLETMMLSRDAYPVARRFADRLGLDYVLAGISPGRKPHAVRGVRNRGSTVAMVGDESVLDTIKVADVGVLMGPTETLNLIHGESVTARRNPDHGVDVVILRHDVSAVPQMLNLSRRICRIVDRNIIFAWAYNVVAVLASMAGLLHPMAATVLMLGSSVFIETQSNRVRRF